jgi:predicted secreted protein
MSSSTRVLSENDSGKAISLLPGEQFELVLSGNPTSGYQWDTHAYDDALIQLAGKPEFLLNSSSVGAGGLFKFAFSALKPGHTVLRLIYHRPFEKKAVPQREFTLSVNISSPGEVSGQTK